MMMIMTGTWTIMMIMIVTGTWTNYDDDCDRNMDKL